MRVGLDLGSSAVRISEAKGGVVYSQPNLIALDPTLVDPLLVGDQAVPVLGRHPDHVQTVQPCKGGGISAPAAMKVMLERILPQTFGWRWKFRPVVRVGYFSGTSELARRRLARILKGAGATAVEWIPNPVAAAFGVDAQVASDRALLVLDIGSATSEIAAVAPGVVVGRYLSLGGQDFDRAIAVHLRQQRGLEVDLESARQVKHAIGSAEDEGTLEPVDVWGRELGTGLPLSLRVSAEEIRQAMMPGLEQLAELVRQVLDSAPPNLAVDLLRSGLTLTGGGAKLRGLAGFLRRKADIEVSVADESETALARGLLTARIAIN